MRLRTLYSKTIGWRVIAGPFRGMHYVAETHPFGSVHAPKLLGTYECELRSQIELLIAHAPDVVVNIGAGEGYYAVGLARRLPATRIIAFEADSRGRELTARVAAMNGVSTRVNVRGLCALPDLSDALRDAHRPAVLIDAEGAEKELLDPVRISALANAVVIVEVHDMFVPLVGDLLLSRFSATHRCEEIWTRPRNARDLPGLLWLAMFTPWRGQAIRAMDEPRGGPMRWFYFVPSTA